MLAIACCLAFFTVAGATEPGARMEPIADKVLDDWLWVVGLDAEPPGKLLALKLAWIPPRSRKACEGKLLGDCWRLDRDARKPSSKKPKEPSKVLDLSAGSSDAAEHAALMARLAKLPAVSARLEGLDYAHHELDNASPLARAFRGNDPRKSFDLPIDSRSRVRARVRWILYPNGEGLRWIGLTRAHDPRLGPR